jgi:hypothetical protein
LLASHANTIREYSIHLEESMRTTLIWRTQIWRIQLDWKKKLALVVVFVLGALYVSYSYRRWRTRADLSLVLLSLV